LLWLVKAGRPDVIGPLANGYLGYDRVYRILCMGEANHPGLGGPIVIDGVRIPQNSARKPTWGIEVEGGYQTWEEIDKLGPDMLQTMGRLDCALAEWSRRPLTSQMEHKTWAPARKVDRKDFDVARTRGIALSRKWFAAVKPPPTPQPGDGKMYVLARDDSNKIWLIDGVFRRLVQGAEDAEYVRQFFKPQQENGRAYTSLPDRWIHSHPDAGSIAETYLYAKGAYENTKLETPETEPSE
jgi:hypothetical protein